MSANDSADAAELTSATDEADLIESVKGVDVFFNHGSRLFAHRGLHETGDPENSLEAFDKARHEGFGIELDVTLCASGEMVLFHDDRIEQSSELERPESLLGRIHDLTFEDIQKAHFSNTGSRIPTLPEVFDLLNGEVNLIIEIKVRVMSACCEAKLSRVIQSTQDCLAASGKESCTSCQ